MSMVNRSAKVRVRSGSILPCPKNPAGLSATRRAAIGLLMMSSVGCAHGDLVTFEAKAAPLRVQQPALYPETIEYDAKRGRFLLGSIRQGSVYAVDNQGRTSQVIDDPHLCSVLGIAIDAAHDWLWVVNADLGSSVKPSVAGPKKVAAVAIYELGSGKPVNYVDLAPLLSGPHLLNGLALDAGGRAYVTDSFSPAIYRVTADGHGAVFLQNSAFLGEGLNLNGLVVHPDGYLLVVKKSDGTLFRIPLAEPARFSKVAVPQIVAADGVTLLGKDHLLIIANQVPGQAFNRAYSLSSDDGWLSAQVGATYSFGSVYPTTGVLRDGKLYAVYSELDELIQATSEQKARLRLEATILPFGSFEP